MVRPRRFLPGPTKKFSPKWRENWREKIRLLNRQKCPCPIHSSSFFPLVFLFLWWAHCIFPFFFLFFFFSFLHIAFFFFFFFFIIWFPRLWVSTLPLSFFFFLFFFLFFLGRCLFSFSFLTRHDFYFLINWVIASSSSSSFLVTLLY